MTEKIKLPGRPPYPTLPLKGRAMKASVNIPQKEQIPSDFFTKRELELCKALCSEISRNPEIFNAWELSHSQILSLSNKFYFLSMNLKKNNKSKKSCLMKI